MISSSLKKSSYPNWFIETSAVNFFTDLLEEFKDKENLHFLQIGAFTGDASLWLMQNILTHKSSILTDVDTWHGSDEEIHHLMDFSDVEKTYDWKLMDHTRVIKCKMDSHKFLMHSDNKKIYDFIYIDGDHTAESVFKDAMLSWKALKPGGIMAFDDYEWGSELPFGQQPKPAVDLFLTLMKEHLELLESGSQVWIRKSM